MKNLKVGLIVSLLMVGHGLMAENDSCAYRVTQSSKNILAPQAGLCYGATKGIVVAGKGLLAGASSGALFGAESMKPVGEVIGAAVSGYYFIKPAFALSAAAAVAADGSIEEVMNNTVKCAVFPGVLTGGIAGAGAGALVGGAFGGAVGTMFGGQLGCQYGWEKGNNFVQSIDLQKSRGLTETQEAVVLGGTVVAETAILAYIAHTYGPTIVQTIKDAFQQS